MALTDLFRPKYKHSDAQVRAQAVKQMGADEADLLARIAETDKDPEVRRLAIERIDDAEFLVDLVATEQSPSVRRQAHKRAAEIWCRLVLGGDRDNAMAAIARLAMLDDQAHLAEVVQKTDDAEVRDVALGRLSDERALADLVRKGPDSTTRRVALEKIDDPEVLRAIAIDESRKPLGIAAVERIVDLGVLEQIATKAKNKHVRARAQKRRSELSDSSKAEVSSEEKRAHAERVQLVREVKAVVRTKEWAQSHKTVVAAQARWAELGDGADPELVSKFATLSEKYMARYETVGVKVLEAIENKKAEEARIRAELETAEAAAAVPAHAMVDEDSARMYREKAEEEEDAEAITGVLDGEFGDALAGDKDDASAQQASQKEAREQRLLVNVARLEALCIEIEELATIDRFRVADRKLSQAAKTFSSLRLPPGEQRDALVERYEEARRQAIIHSKDLQKADEWKRWSVLPKLEALIARAQGLLEREDVGRLGGELKNLQTEWKEAGPGPHAKNQELWERFKATCDQVYEHVKGHRKVAADEQRENLGKKVELCQQVEALVESTDWDETAEKIKSLQVEWKSVGPVPRKKSKQVWERFRAACDQFFDRRKPILEERLEEFRENLEEKQAICKEIEELAEADIDWDDARDQLAELRSKWRGIGHVPRQDYGPLMERFRAASDRVFGRREEAAKAKLEETRREVEGLITKLDSAMQSAGVDAGWDDEDVAESKDEADMVKVACELRSAALELGDDNADTRERARALIRAAVEASPEAFDGSELDPQTSRRRRLRLIERLEELLPEEGEALKIEELSAEEVAAKLREALASNALGIVSEAKRPVAQIVSEVRTSWNLIGPVPGRDGVELNERFEVARQRVLDAYADDDE